MRSKLGLADSHHTSTVYWQVQRIYEHQLVYCTRRCTVQCIDRYGHNRVLRLRVLVVLSRLQQLRRSLADGFTHCVSEPLYLEAEPTDSHVPDFCGIRVVQYTRMLTCSVYNIYNMYERCAEYYRHSRLYSILLELSLL